MILALVTVVTAWFSVTFFHPDEHFQILEFMSHRLGRTAASDLPWEFHYRIRAWMQPFLYFLVARPLIGLGLHDIFDVTFVLRLATGLISLAALAAFARAFLASLTRTDERNFFAGALPFFGFLPYLFVRTSSEILSADFFTLALALVMGRRTAARFILAGLLSGLAFECRFQSAILVLPLLAWLAIVARARLTHLGLFGIGFVAVIGLAAPIDHWGYGVWCFPPWDYFKVNLLDNVAAQRFGTDPFFAYPYLLIANIFLPVLVMLVLAMVLVWIRQPRHIVTWVSLPFFLIHSVIAHKEERFLFPLYLLATSFPVLAFAPSGKAWPNWARRLWPYRTGGFAKAIGALSVATMALLAVYPPGFISHLPAAQYFYRSFPNGLTVYTFAPEPFRSFPMYRPVPYRSHRLADNGALQDLLAKGPVYLLSETPNLPPDTLPPRARAQLLYSEWPFARAPAMATFGTRVIQFDGWLNWKIFGLKIPQFTCLTIFRVEPA